jgi:hypothetical protein
MKSQALTLITLILLIVLAACHDITADDDDPRCRYEEATQVFVSPLSPVATPQRLFGKETTTPKPTPKPTPQLLPSWWLDVGGAE